LDTAWPDPVRPTWRRRSANRYIQSDIGEVAPFCKHGDIRSWFRYPDGGEDGRATFPR
jgi:hypothetical protein